MKGREADRMARVLITGGAGLLGGALLRSTPAGIEAHATQRATPVTAPAVGVHALDLADAAAGEALWAELRPALVVHTAYSMSAGERDVVVATRNVAAACAETGAALIHLSTDALLDGQHAPYAEDAAPAPVHEYGRWKAEAEVRVRELVPDAAVIRTSLITSLDPPDPRTAWVLDSLREGRPITLFTDELRCPIAADDLARQLWEIAALPRERRAGVWNLVGPEAVSRYALGVLTAAAAGLDASGITPARSAASPVPRPRDVRLLTPRADRELESRARPISELLVPAPGNGRA
jgi:dTDP-4-dehydrorhamnose reductase